ncbi:MAG TPA: RNA polymerase sigma factor [Polyangiaceae bacterium]|nr:RNA polymerase sigma factor [Polyangiaceae bacterium]
MNPLKAKTDLSERQFFEAVYTRMHALAGPAAGDLDDLVQVAAEQAFRSIHRFDGSCELGTWIYAVCYRVLLNQRRWYRRWSLRFSPLTLDDDAASDEPTPTEILEARARARQLYRALARMTEKYRAVVVLHDLEELSVAELAQVVGAGELTVRSRLRDGRKQLAKLLQAEELQATGAPDELTTP